jgi:uncharacterized protein (TIGR03435 family)
MRRIDSVLLLVIAISIAALRTASISAQGTATPKFEVVSVKPCAPGNGAGRGVPGQRGGAGGGGTVVTSPGRLVVNCMSVSSMINIYITVTDTERLINESSRLLDEENNRRRVRGGPAWVYSDRYTINAETSDPAAAAPTQEGFTPTKTSALLQGPMLRLLLEERLQLNTHRQTEEVPMYSLTVAKGGFKMKPMEEGGCASFDPSKNRPRDTPPGGKPWCTQGIGFADPRAIQSDWTINGAGQPMSSLAGALSIVMGRYVFNKTEVSGVFSYSLRFAHDDTTPGEFPSGQSSQSPQAMFPRVCPSSLSLSSNSA